ncbi:BTB/POZ protein [Mycena galericulata]|nr:BTB/POZ protein [Mycena galericulata]KAJ7438321.1 BTB/POZ protein [Mycena galericulata]
MLQAASENDWVRVTSDDGYSFLVRRKVANASETMRDMLDTAGNYAEAITRTCPVSQRAVIVEKLLEYQSFKSHYETVGPKEEVPIHEFMDRIPPEIVLELMLAADYQNM